MGDFSRGTQLIVALDVDGFDKAKQLVDLLKEDVDFFKVGSQLFTASGPAIVNYIMSCGRHVFLDLKFHDIPNTVANAVASAVGLNAGSTDDGGGIFMLTVHISGGEAMLINAVESAAKHAERLKVMRPFIVGITVLTSQDKVTNIDQIVLDKAKVARRCGLDGVVASANEAGIIRQNMGEDFIIVTPGIRPSGAAADDQKRIATPKDAVANGSSFIVVGRPIVMADDPAAAARGILDEIAA